MLSRFLSSKLRGFGAPCLRRAHRNRWTAPEQFGGVLPVTVCATVGHQFDVNVDFVRGTKSRIDGLRRAMCAWQ
jgi:hypothetical protein